jgi:hypothetical protein
MTESTSLLPRELITPGASPLLRVTLGPDGVQAYPGRVPMVSKVKLEGQRVTVSLKFRISLFSVGFEFVADATVEENRSLELRHVAGEPRGLRLRFDVLPDGAGSIVYAAVSFDVMSLGWLAKYFLRHHPEIQYGIFPGAALALLDSMRRSVISSSGS